MSDNRSKEFILKNVVRAIPEVTIWKLLGLNLDVPGHKLEEIQQSYPRNIPQCRYELVSYWLNNDLEASWKKLADALDQVEHHSLANRIRRQYVCSEEGRKVERSRTPSPLAALHTRINPFSFPHHPPVITRQPSILPSTHNDAEQRRTSSEMASSSKSILCLFCGSFKTTEKTTDIIKAPKRRYVELLQKSMAPDKMLQYLLQGTLDAFYVEKEGRTLLHFAAIHCSVESLKTLVAFRGPDVSPVSAQGQTPLDLAGLNVNGGSEIKTLLQSVGGQEYSTLSKKQETVKLPRSSEGSRMLVLNCSGLSAILHIETLQQLERQSGRKVFEMFEWVVASGFSAVFILFMVYGRQSLADVRRLYFELQQSILRQKPCSRALEAFLKAHLAPEMKMSSTKEPKILLPAVCKTATGGVQTHILNNCLQDRFSEVPVWKVAYYLCCHPPHIPEMDGYLGRRDSAHLNLSSLGERRVRQFYRERGMRENRVSRVVRLDQGQYDNHNPQLLDPITAEEDTKIGRCFVFNPVLPCPLFLSLSVDDIDVVDCVIETMRQVSDRMVNLVKFLSS